MSRAVPVPTPRPSSSEAERAWAVTKDTTSTAILEAFVQRFAGTPYADMARARIQELKSTSAGTVSRGAPGGAPVGALGAPQSLGCFRDQATTRESVIGGTDGRDLNGYFVQESGMTVEHCVSLCREHGFAYAGTQFATQCFCGNSYGRSGTARCDMLCAGNRSEVCGGVWANSVYRVP